MSLSRVIAPFAAAWLAFAALPGFANPLDRVDEDDQEALEALAVYPEDKREDALEVATEADTLVDLQKLQEDSQDTFRDLLEPYSQDDQEQLFELSRYPDLVESISRGGPKSRGELERLAASYPEDVRSAAVRQGADRHKVVSRMYALLDDFDRRFDDLIEDLSPRKQEAFRSMLGTPELLSLMAEHTNMTVILGDAFDRNPDAVRAALGELNLEVARRNAEEADDWKRTVDSDPELRRDYDQAALDYRRSTGYDAYSGPSRPVVQVSINPYPYWVGYPWWYPVSYTYYDPWYWWYPRRSWGHCGYSYGPRVVFHGGPVYRPWYPSYHFTSWYFSFGHHHARYPYLSDRFVSYYDRPVIINNHYHYTSVRKRVVRKFVYESDHVMPANYFKSKNRRDRVERFREFGRVAPDIEKVRAKSRKQEFSGKNRKRPGRDFRLADQAAEDRAARAEVKKLVSKNPQKFPELAKVKQTDWEQKPPKRGRNGKRVIDDDAPAFESGGGKNRAKSRGEATPAKADKPGKSRAGNGNDAPGFESTDKGKNRAKNRDAAPRKIDDGEVRPKIDRKRTPEKTFDAGGNQNRAKARPTLQNPSDPGGGGGGGGNKNRNKARSFDASPSDGGGGKSKVRSSDAAPGGGGGGGNKNKVRASDRQFEGGGGGGKKQRQIERSYESAPKYEAPKQRNVERPRQPQKQKQQQYQQPRSFEKQGGGGGSGGGGKNRAKNRNDEEQGGGGGGGGGGGKRRNQ